MARTFLKVYPRRCGDSVDSKTGVETVRARPAPLCWTPVRRLLAALSTLSSFGEGAGGWRAALLVMVMMIRQSGATAGSAGFFPTNPLQQAVLEAETAHRSRQTGVSLSRLSCLSTYS